MTSEINSPVEPRAINFCSDKKNRLDTVLKVMGFAGLVLTVFAISYISWVNAPEFVAIRKTFFWNCAIVGTVVAWVSAIFYLCINYVFRSKFPS